MSSAQTGPSAPPGSPARIAPPSRLLVPLEGRAWLELAAFFAMLPALASAPRGDGHPVLVLPGWLATDASTRPLRWFLRDRGYRAHAWRLGRNLGPRPEVVSGLGARFLGLQEQSGEKLSVIGWSLGGIYARELARRFPERVRQVITLASPFRDPEASSVAWLARRRGAALQSREFEARRVQLAAPLPVPSTALYSRTDGVVAWRSCLEDDGPTSQSIEVRSSHCGMGHHPSALAIIADRLAQPADAWQRYEARAESGWRFLQGLLRVGGT
jgi:pimeloyl-ACP methyl ester carboxylesterase